jgi:soluble lytic murein transglycosylase-like protein
MAVEASPPEPLPVRPREPSGPWADTWARAYPDRWSPNELKPIGSAYAPMIREAARRYHLDPKLLMAIAQVESHHRADARSQKGALGLMQVMPATGARYGVQQSQNLYDPEVNVDVAARYLNDLLDMFNGSQRLAVAAYNAGEGAVQRYGGKVPPFPETRRYVQVVLALKDRM